MKGTKYSIKSTDYRVKEDDTQQEERFRASQEKLIKELTATIAEFVRYGNYKLWRK